MPVSHKHKLVFIHVPKNAGTSITKQLDLENAGHYHWSHELPRDGYRSLSIVRNPWDRVVSCYEYARMEESFWHSAIGPSREGKHLDYDLLKNMSFENCVKLLAQNSKALRHQGWIPQWWWICDNDKNLKVDHVIKMESIDLDLNILFENLEIPNIELKKINPSPINGTYQSYYNEQTKQIVGQLYKDDIDLFDYKFD